MTPTPQRTFSPAAGRATMVDDVHPDGAAHADRLWGALSRAREGKTPRIRAHSEDAVYRFYLPLAHTLARGADRYPHDPDEVEQAAELGLAQAVLAWRHPTGRGFDRIATAAIIGHLQRAHGQTTRHLPGQFDRKSQQRTVAHHPVDE